MIGQMPDIVNCWFRNPSKVDVELEMEDVYVLKELLTRFGLHADVHDISNCWRHISRRNGAEWLGIGDGADATEKIRHYFVLNKEE